MNFRLFTIKGLLLTICSDLFSRGGEGCRLKLYSSNNLAFTYKFQE